MPDIYTSLHRLVFRFAVGIATDYGLDDREFGVRVPVGSEFYFLHMVQTGSGVHPASYPIGTGGFFPGGKAAGA
jgi:hypothetical protein